MAKLIAAGCLLGVGYWLLRRLAPAIKTEPATWLGDDWRERVRAWIRL